MTTGLVEWLRSQLDADEVDHSGPIHRCLDKGRTCYRLRTVAAHRAILDRHGPGVSHPDECGRCNDPWPCGDVLSIAAIFEGRDGFDPSWRADT